MAEKRRRKSRHKQSTTAKRTAIVKRESKVKKRLAFDSVDPVYYVDLSSSSSRSSSTSDSDSDSDSIM